METCDSLVPWALIEGKRPNIEYTLSETLRTPLSTKQVLW